MPTELDEIERQLKESERKRERATALALEGIASSRRFLATIRLQHTALGELQDELDATLKTKEQLIREALTVGPADGDEAPEAATQ